MRRLPEVQTPLGITLDAPHDDAYDLVIAIASGAAPYQQAAASLAAWHDPAVE